MKILVGVEADQRRGLPSQVPDPILRSALMPQYPPLALATRVEGEVKASFVLDTKGEVASVELLSGHPLLRGAAAAVVKSWKFELPKLFRTEWRYDTSFRYHLPGRELESIFSAFISAIGRFVYNYPVHMI